MSIDKRMLNLAASVAAEGQSRHDNRSFFLGAVGMRRDGVIVSARNIAATDVTPTAHAEARVVKKLTCDSIVWVARVGRGAGNWALARPCNKCMLRMLTAGVRKVVYTIAPNEWGIIQL
jgi:tRNA(Arg) A34 adenosine deaminase TadA